jgi:hypothetical protein
VTRLWFFLGWPARLPQTFYDRRWFAINNVIFLAIIEVLARRPSVANEFDNARIDSRPDFH